MPTVIANMRSVLIAKAVERATPHRQLDVILSDGRHVGALILWAFAATFVGCALAVLFG